MHQDAPRKPATEPIDPDLGSDTTPGRLTARLRARVPVVTVVAAGGGLGAAARYGAGLAWPTGTAAFPWTTMFINVAGCALIGVLFALIGEVWVAHRLVRPFLGTGVLGGFTTFSTYAADVARLVDIRDARTGLVYLVLTPALGLVVVWLAAAATRRVAARRPR